MLNCIDQHRFVAQTNGPSQGGQAPGLKALVNNPTADSEGTGMVDYPPRHLSNRSWYKTGMPAIRWVLIKDPKV